MRITESRLRQIIQEVMSEVEEQEPRHANPKSTEVLRRRAQLEKAVYGLLGAYIDLHDGDDEDVAEAVLGDVKVILGLQTQ